MFPSSMMATNHRLRPARRVRTLAERHADSGSLLAELNRIFLDNLPPAS